MRSSKPLHPIFLIHHFQCTSKFGTGMERMVEVPGNVVILEDENELLEKMMMMMMTTMKNHQKAVKKYTPCTSTHMHIHLHQTNTRGGKGRKKRLFALCTTSLHMHAHICTKHTCLKRKKRVVKECVFFFFGWMIEPRFAIDFK